MDISASEQAHIEDVRRAIKLAEEQDARFRARGFSDSVDFSKEMQRRGIRRRYSAAYGAIRMKEVGL